MGFEMLTGRERDEVVDKAGCCEHCGFMERGLLAYRTRGPNSHAEPMFFELFAVCRECADARRVENRDGLVALYLPEMDHTAFPHYVRTMAWATFAARIDALGGHDFSTGRLPAAFGSPDAWARPLKWKSLAEGIGDADAGEDAVRAMKSVKSAFDFVRQRAAWTQAKYGRTYPADLARIVGDEVFAEKFRVLDPTPDLERIRSWGAAGSSFRIAARRHGDFGDDNV